MSRMLSRQELSRRSSVQRSVFDLLELHNLSSQRYSLLPKSDSTIIRPSIYKPRQFTVTSSATDNITLQNAIAEIEETSSAEEEYSEEYDKIWEYETEDKTKTRETETSQKAIEEHEVAKMEAIKENWETDSDDDTTESEDEWEYLKQGELKDESEFVEHNIVVPGIEEISIDLVDLSLIKPKYLKLQSKHRKDSGEFVNPLTGIPLSSSLDIENLFASTESETDMDKIDSEEFLRPSFSFDMFGVDDEKDNDSKYEDKRHTPDVEEDALHFFFDKAKIVDFESQIETEVIRLQEQRKLEKEIAMRQLIYQLIDKCVDNVEFLNKDKVFRAHLDKRKLMSEIKTKYSLLVVERAVLHFLNKKTVDHFKHKKAFGAISGEKNDNSAVYRSRFQGALNDLDSILSKERDLKATSTSKLIDLEKKLKTIEKQSEIKVDNLEELIRSTFERKQFKKFSTTLNNSVDKMSEIRNEISKVRLKLLLKLHEFSTLDKRKQDFEDIGNGLTVTKFEALDTETRAVGKKLEEQILFLKRLYNTCNTNFHKIAHIKEKHKMMKNMVISQKLLLEDLCDTRNNARENVNKLKKEHSDLRYEIDNITFNGGVLFKPDLIKDYDKTVETVNKLRERNENLREQIKEMNTMIASMEKNCLN